MDNDEFRTWARRIADWSHRYAESLADKPVRAQTSPGDIAAQIPSAPPEAPETMEAIFADFERIVTPGLTHWRHPRFMAYFPANTSPPSILADQLIAALAAQCMLWQTSPAGTELETCMTDWLRQAIGLPPGFSGVIQDSASTATLCAVLTMRERALSWRSNAHGLAGEPRLRIYCSEYAHSSVEKAVGIAGIGRGNLVPIETPGPLAGLDPAALAALPVGVVASLGATGVGACDDIAALAEIARAEGLYLHVDAAWAGSAMICPELRGAMAGAEAADSFVFNPHKWLGVGFDCSVQLVRAPQELTRTLSIQPAYLQTPGRGGILNYSDWTTMLGRRFRALKIWFVLRTYGLERLRAMIRNHIAWAEEIAEEMEAAPDFEVTTPPSFSLFSFRHRPAQTDDLNAHTLALVNRINDDGRTYVTQTSVGGETVIRFQVGAFDTTRCEVHAAWKAIAEIPRSPAAQAPA